MNTVTAKRDLLENCQNREYREALNEENVYSGICAQLRTLREQRGLSQSQFGKKAKMAQERISILEDPNAETKPTLNTLLRLASAYDVGLDVRFVPFSVVLDRSTKTDEHLLQVDSFDEELPEMEKDLALEETLASAQVHIQTVTMKKLASGLPTPELQNRYYSLFRNVGVPATLQQRAGVHQDRVDTIRDTKIRSIASSPKFKQSAVIHKAVSNEVISYRTAQEASL